MKEEFIELRGKEKGSTSIILAGVHGDERCGIEAFKKLLPNLQINRGRVLFGYGNPIAIQANVRFIETNLNRMFKADFLLSSKDKMSYEYERAQFLKKYMDQADVLLDIHSSSNPQSQRFLICEPNSAEITKYLPFNLVVSGFDKVQSGGTDYYMNSIGKIGICAECGYHNDPEAILVAEKVILSFLSIRGHIPKTDRVYKQSYIHVYQMYLAKTDNFILSKVFSDFQEVSTWEVIGIDGQEKVIAEKDSVIIFPDNINEIGGEAFLLGEKRKGPAQ